ncbi:protein moonraker [Polypterus senegalus]|uniref:protein moonraker n=1 Tax=Polypterus senegalus TaxID=55291 RepID=UPI001964C697|nr:protein moonraker [Polypterus senegalus]
MKPQKWPLQVTFAKMNQMGGTWKADAQTRNQFLQNQLQFNRDVPAMPANLATRFCNPAPIIIEKLAPFKPCNDPSSPQVAYSPGTSESSMQFSVISEERLQWAVKKAQRDLRRQKQMSMLADSLQEPATVNAEDEEPCEKMSHGLKQKTKKPNNTSARAEVMPSGASVLVYIPEKLIHPTSAKMPVSPPTKDFGPVQRQGSPFKNQEGKLLVEMCRLQKELNACKKGFEEIANRGEPIEPLDPEEVRRAHVRRQEQAARSARIIYALQQRVKEILEEVDRFSPHKDKNAIKSRAMDRLIVAHRGTVRALQVFVSQLSDQMETRVPSYYRELAKLVRQLALCSAKLVAGAGVGRAVSESTINILEQLENLEVAIQATENQKKKDPHVRGSSSSPLRKSSAPRRRGAMIGKFRASAANRKNTRGITHSSKVVSKTDHSSSLDRNEVLKAGINNLLRLGVLKKEEHATSKPPSQKGVLLVNGPQGFRKTSQPVNVQFYQSTLASKLKENQPPIKENTTPWIPPHPTSPPASPKRAPWKKQNLRVPLLDSQEHKSPGRECEMLKEIMEKERKHLMEHEAVRQAWLETEMVNKANEVKKLLKEETDHVLRLRSEAASPTRWAETAEREARKRLEPLLDRAQKIGDKMEKNTSLKNRLSMQAAEKAAWNADLLSEKILDELLEDTVQALWNIEENRQIHQAGMAMQDSPTLEAMLARMEEMEKDQEAVRQRLTRIIYSDPDVWTEVDKTGKSSHEKKPVNPLPIKITKSMERRDPSVEIIVEAPVESNVVHEDSSIEEQSQENENPTIPKAVEFRNPAATTLFLPKRMQQNILDYRERHEAFLRLIYHDAVGGFNPWDIVNSLAEELMSEALSEVAAEFQGVCEEYAEAVFTSEFL